MTDPDRDAALVRDVLALAAVAADIVAEGEDAFRSGPRGRSYLAGKMIVIDIATAASRLSEGFRREHPEIPWSSVVGMRNRLAHDYERVDVGIVWRTLSEAIPDLASRLAPA